DASGSAAGGKPKGDMGTLAPAKRIDPLVMKVYRAESCYFGTLSLRHAKAAYLASVGDGEPSAAHLPDFAVEDTETPDKGAAAGATPASSAAPAASGAKAAGSAAPKPAAPPATAKATTAAPKASAAAAAPPKASGAAAAAPPGSAGAAGRPDMARMRMKQVPYERFARSCNVAATLKEPASPELDAALKEYSDFVLPLSKKLNEANAYYQKEDFKSDDFAKGKEFNKDIKDGFGKLDDQLKKLRDALDKFEAANPIKKDDYTESQKLSDAVVTASRDVILKLDAGESSRDALTKLEAATDALKKFGDDHKDDKDPWATIVPPSAMQLVEFDKPLADDPKAVTSAKVVSAINLYTRILEANHRSLTRKLAEGAGRMINNQRLIKPKLPAGHPQ
ncbi:MAG TPA: DUF3829 domain-containing protein, partial [Polyangiaceae bacterium]|nr:DUF3829 domain-containing protein [Polyangiaceae bacterium]